MNRVGSGEFLIVRIYLESLIGLLVLVVLVLGLWKLAKLLWAVFSN